MAPVKRPHRHIDTILYASLAHTDTLSPPRTLNKYLSDSNLYEQKCVGDCENMARSASQSSLFICSTLYSTLNIEHLYEIRIQHPIP